MKYKMNVEKGIPGNLFFQENLKRALLAFGRYTNNTAAIWLPAEKRDLPQSLCVIHREMETEALN